MGKVIILGGNARSGKTTLSNRLASSGFYHISFDDLYEFMKESLNVDVDSMSHEKKIAIFDYIFNKTINGDIDYVLDVYDFLPSDLQKYKDLDDAGIYFLAYPNCTKEEIKYNVIHYAKPTDWIAQVNEKYLNECVERFDKRNKVLLEECNKYNMTLIDTKSGKDRDIVLDNLYNTIVGLKKNK
jgi:adenylate kinase family enzyme